MFVKLKKIKTKLILFDVPAKCSALRMLKKWHGPSDSPAYSPHVHLKKTEENN